jgi:hypothetical protein
MAAASGSCRREIKGKRGGDKKQGKGGPTAATECQAVLFLTVAGEGAYGGGTSISSHAISGSRVCGAREEDEG